MGTNRTTCLHPRVLHTTEVVCRKCGAKGQLQPDRRTIKWGLTTRLWNLLRSIVEGHFSDGSSHNYSSDNTCDHSLEKTADLIRCLACGARGKMEGGLLKWDK